MSRKMTRSTLPATLPAAPPLTTLLGSALLSVCDACRDIRLIARAG